MQFLENPTHLYECTAPPLPLVPRVYTHPKWDLLRCLEGGVLILDHDVWDLSSDKNGGVTVSKNYYGNVKNDFTNYWPIQKRGRGNNVRLGVKPTIVYECYHGKSLDKWARIGFWNHNPYDYRKNNLFDRREMERGKGHLMKAWRRAGDDFFRHTWEVMRGIAIQRGYNGIETQEWIADYALPPYYIRRLLKYAKEFAREF